MIENFIEDHLGWVVISLFLLGSLMLGFGIYHADKRQTQELERVSHLTHEQYCSERYYGQTDQRCIGFFAPATPRVNPHE